MMGFDQEVIGDNKNTKGWYDKVASLKIKRQASSDNSIKEPD